MAYLKRGHTELFRRTPDECFPSLDALAAHCKRDKELTLDRWYPPRNLLPRPSSDRLELCLGNDGAFTMNDWSFGQLCQQARFGKEMVNRLSPDTASRVLLETLPQGNKPIQLLTRDSIVRSIHGVSYTRLHNADLLEMIRASAVGFEPPQEAVTGGTGLYCGEQDLFCFLIDPTGWTEINGEAFAPGFFLWNSEVGKRSVGVETFWFQAVCANHIVWDAVEVVEFTRKHTANVHESFGEMRSILEALAAKRDQRRDGFAKVMKKAMETRLGDDVEEVAKVLSETGIPRNIGKQALELAREQGRFTIFSLVDALTRLARECKNAGERTDADQRAARLLALAA
jgi:histone H3/H4